jgi:DNA-binding transcriptional ArsR family regulator
MNDDDLDHIFKALGDPTRRKIIDRLRERPGQSLFEICALFFAENGMALSRQAITQHIDMLQKAGLVRVEWWLRHHL